MRILRLCERKFLFSFLPLITEELPAEIRTKLFNQLPVTNYQLPITSYQLPVCRLRNLMMPRAKLTQHDTSFRYCL
ncbi:MAG: hypothetical protein AB1414_06695 [bacterium]